MSSPTTTTTPSVDELEKKINNLNEQIIKLTEEKDELTTKNNQLDKQFKNLENENKALKNKTDGDINQLKNNYAKCIEDNKTFYVFFYNVEKIMKEIELMYKPKIKGKPLIEVFYSPEMLNPDNKVYLDGEKMVEGYMKPRDAPTNIYELASREITTRESGKLEAYVGNDGKSVMIKCLQSSANCLKDEIRKMDESNVKEYLKNIGVNLNVEPKKIPDILKEINSIKVLMRARTAGENPNDTNENPNYTIDQNANINNTDVVLLKMETLKLLKRAYVEVEKLMDINFNVYYGIVNSAKEISKYEFTGGGGNPHKPTNTRYADELEIGPDEKFKDSKKDPNNRGEQLPKNYYYSKKEKKYYYINNEGEIKESDPPSGKNQNQQQQQQQQQQKQTFNSSDMYKIKLNTLIEVLHIFYKHYVDYIKENFRMSNNETNIDNLIEHSKYKKYIDYQKIYKSE